MTSAFSWQNSISLCPTSFCYSKPNLPVTPGISWLPTFAFQSPIMKRILYEKGCASLYYRVSISSPNREGQWPRPSQPDPHRFYWQYIERLYLPISADSLGVWGCPLQGNVWEMGSETESRQLCKTPRSSDTCIPCSSAVPGTWANNCPLSWLVWAEFLSLATWSGLPANPSQGQGTSENLQSLLWTPISLLHLNSNNWKGKLLDHLSTASTPSLSAFPTSLCQPPWSSLSASEPCQSHLTPQHPPKTLHSSASPTYLCYKHLTRERKVPTPAKKEQLPCIVDHVKGNHTLFDTLTNCHLVMVALPYCLGHSGFLMFTE